MITNVTVFVDDNELEFMDGAIRCGYIVAEDENGAETFHHDLLDNSGFPTIKELVDEVTGILNVDRDVVLVAA